MTKKMKTSELEWLVEIPVDWDVQRIRYLFSFEKGLNITKENLVEEGLDVISYGQIHSKQNTGTGINDSLVRYVSEDYLRTGKQSLVQLNDFIFADTSEDLNGVGNCVFVDIEKTMFAGYHSIIARSKGDVNFFSKYLAYQFLTDCWRSQLRSKTTGIKVYSITQKILRESYIILPPIKEQLAITSFLDKQCGEIDSIIRSMEQQVDLLKQYKKTLITQIVTNGLNRHAEMKDSCIEWIEKIPKSWDVIPFQHVLHERNEKNVPVITEERLSLSIDKGVTLYSEKTTNLDRYKEDVSQYKIARPGDFVMNSMNMIVGAVGISEYLGCVSPAYYIFYDTEPDHITAKYCDYLFRSKSIMKYLFALGKGIMAIERGDDRVNTCRLKVSRYDLNKLKLPIPPLDEQRKIVEFLNKTCANVDNTIVEKQQSIETLHKYKKSLIHEYVTGKKRVKEVVE